MTRRNMAEQMFNDVMNTIRDSQSDLENTISRFTSGGASTGLAGPLADLIEDQENILVKIDLPGVKKENIKIDITDQTLLILAQQEEEVLWEGARYVERERKLGKTERTIALPAKIRIEDAIAAFEDGVLTVTLPKIEKKETFGVRVD